jgi:hypothetical protein
MTTAIVGEKLDGFTEENKEVVRFIFQHGAPTRAELAEKFGIHAADEATRKAILVRLLSEDKKPHRYAIVPDAVEAIRNILFDSVA